jgi:hypothetical protein
VNALTATVSVAPTASSITYGSPLSSSILSGGSAVVTGGSTPVPGRFTWNSPNNVPDVGGAAQNVTFTPSNGNYATVSLTVSVPVIAATPTVTGWPTASSISVGQTLGSSILSGGTASLAGGNFAWTSSSTHPPAGTSSYSVTYTPALVNGYADYGNVTGWVSVIVNPCGYQDPNPANNAYSTALYVYNANGTTPTPALPNPVVIDAEGSNASAICAVNSGPSDATVNPTINYPAITSGSASTLAADSSAYGMNAAVVAYGTVATANTGATINIVDDGSGDPGSISTANDNSVGVFASMGGTVNITDTIVTTSGVSSHALDATYQGTLKINGVTASTAGNNSSVILAGVGGGNVRVDGGAYTASGQRSAAIRVAGTGSLVTVLDDQAATNVTALNGPAVAIEGGNTVTITSTGGGITLSGAQGANHGIFLYQGNSGDATAASIGTPSSFSMTGGSLAYSCDATSIASCAQPGTDQNNPATLFSVANTTATITLTDVLVTNNTPYTGNSNGTLLTAAALTSGTSPNNGGIVSFTAYGETLTGDIIVDNNSAVSVSLLADSASVPVASQLTGTINGAQSTGTVNLTLDATSTWIVTGNSYLTGLTNAVSNNSNITCQNPGACSVYLNNVLVTGVN